jgi:hypothetical protein
MEEDARFPREPVLATEVLDGATHATNLFHGTICALRTTGVRSSRDNDQWGE